MRPDGTEWDLGAGSFGKVVKGLVNGEQVLTRTPATAVAAEFVAAHVSLHRWWSSSSRSQRCERALGRDARTVVSSAAMAAPARLLARSCSEGALDHGAGGGDEDGGPERRGCG